MIPSVYLFVSACVCDVYMCVCVCVCVYVCRYMYIYICVCVCVCVYGCTWVCVYVYVRQRRVSVRTEHIRWRASHEEPCFFFHGAVVLPSINSQQHLAPHTQRW
jgi:hypothetical protein